MSLSQRESRGYYNILVGVFTVKTMRFVKVREGGGGSESLEIRMRGAGVIGV